MGAWGHETFANDTAIDWTYGLDDVADLSLVTATIDEILADDDAFLDEDLCCDVLAACEVIARLKGNWGRQDPYSETVDAWVRANPQPVPGRLVKRAVKAIDRVTDEESGLYQLWAEGKAGEDWLASVMDLRRRVEG